MFSLLFLSLVLPGTMAMSKPVWPWDFRWSNSGPVSGWTCLHITEKVEHDTEHGSEHEDWNDNYLCWKSFRSDPGLAWSSEGVISGMECTHIQELADQHSWTNNYLCAPRDNNYHFTWSSAEAIPGKSCIQWLEARDPTTWNDNFLCADTQFSQREPEFPDDFVFSSSGIPTGYNCLRTHESADPFSWHDNYICWRQTVQDPGMRWSEEGEIEGMRCEKIVEPEDTHADWGDNYLCVEEESPLYFKWSSAGRVEGMECLQWEEEADPHMWHDNFLCV